MYQPGLHIIATINSIDTHLLEKYEGIQSLINELISDNQLEKLGEVYHNFAPSGFTSVVCLSESHLSIHTWPEYNKVNLDIYLSNFLRNNDGTVERIFEALKTHFKGTITEIKKINR